MNDQDPSEELEIRIEKLEDELEELRRAFRARSFAGGEPERYGRDYDCGLKCRPMRCEADCGLKCRPARCEMDCGLKCRPARCEMDCGLKCRPARCEMDCGLKCRPARYEADYSGRRYDAEGDIDRRRERGRGGGYRFRSLGE